MTRGIQLIKQTFKFILLSYRVIKLIISQINVVMEHTASHLTSYWFCDGVKINNNSLLTEHNLFCILSSLQLRTILSICLFKQHGYVDITIVIWTIMTIDTVFSDLKRHLNSLILIENM